MNVYNLFRTKNLATEAGDAVFWIFYDRQSTRGCQSACVLRIAWLHMNHVGRTYDIADATAGAFFDFDVLDHLASSAPSRQ